MPFVPFDDGWEADSEVPAYVGLYEASRQGFSDRLVEAAIPVEKIGRLVLVGGGDDKVWPALEMARVIETRRREHSLDTLVVSDPRGRAQCDLAGRTGCQPEGQAAARWRRRIRSPPRRRGLGRDPQAAVRQRRH